MPAPKPVKKDLTPKEQTSKLLAVMKKKKPTSSQDGAETSQRIMMSQVLEDMIRSPKLVQSCHSHLIHAKAEEAQKEAEANLLQEIPTVARMPPAVQVAQIVRTSDLTLEQVTELRVKDNESSTQLFTFFTGLHAGCRLSQECRNKKVLDSMVDMRVHEMGNRPAQFVLKGSIIDNAINWGKGCYVPTFDKEHVLHSIKHWNGDEVLTGTLGKHIHSKWT